ncbi:D-alanyl-D-alanine carboxypeptidase family protein [Bacillus sp. es.034]|uniref:D-alanyl-D-alanine carboxypeptidase family protein n=1 Tax=Bacillus sp. es.034 TaxID=1761763 RepID=UPI000C00E7D7|nr:D-alanyl-D-alanine carboxypeptidase family protein [Bacillus sp. es.034]PFG06341.1 D-Ala-D-Ala carboxypeptidase A Serine peptidase MEROPS family S11 [Bacillus sp. es.034]
MEKKTVKQSLAVLMISFMAMTPFQQTAHGKSTVEINSDAAILVEADTGKIVYGEHEDKALGIASMTKMMTEYLVLEAIENGKIKWDQTYKVSDKVYQLANAPGLSNVPLRADEEYTVRELYDAMVIKSGNGAAIALSEVVAGSEGKFVKMMNAKAKELGFEHYQFVNSSGLSNYDMLGMYPEGTDVNDENVVSAEDMATLAYYLIHDFPEVLETSSLTSKVFRPGTSEELVMKNTNGLLKGKSYHYKGADGLKTGTTPFAGSTFTGTAKRNGVRYITVILDAKDEYGQPSSAERFIQARELLDYGFDEFKTVTYDLDSIEKKKNHTLPVPNGKEQEVTIKVDKPLSLRLTDEEKDKVKTSLNLDEQKVNEDGSLQAPIEKGEKIGELVIDTNEKEEYIFDRKSSDYKVDVYAAESVKKASWIVRSARGIQDFFGNLF